MTTTATATRGKVQLRANLFGIPFGLAGLALVWRLAGLSVGAPHLVSDVLTALTALVWLVLVVAFARSWSSWADVVAELEHPVFGPFASLAPIVGMLIGALLAGAWLDVSKVVVIVFWIATIALGGWLAGGWVINGLDQVQLHPGYFLPTVAGGLVGAFALAIVGYDRLALLSFGIGVICWLILGAVVLSRLFVAGSLPAPLLPTLAIEVAPPVVAGNAWFIINGAQPDLLQYVFAGYAVLMVVVQLRFIPSFRSLPFGAGFWAFTFSYCAAVSYALRWLSLDSSSLATTAAWVLVTGATVMVAWIGIKSLTSLRKGTFLPRVPA